MGQPRVHVLLAAAAVFAFAMAGCAAVGLQYGPPLEPISMQKLEYYPYQVKGYQSSYPQRTVLVLRPVEAREFLDSGTNDHAPHGDDPAIGITRNQNGKVVQRLYSDPLGPIVQNALAGSAEEAGMTPRLSSKDHYQPGKLLNADYVLASRITRCWVIKRHGPDGSYGPVWATSADFAIDVAIYKPPFSVAFWRGTSQSTYNDPPVGSFGLGPEDEAGIYDEPGEVLSVALTRAVAGIFQRPDLRTLVMQDQIRPR
jgi:ABC-type uncharacterized transport system auxiliary subunit